MSPRQNKREAPTFFFLMSGENYVMLHFSLMSGRLCVRFSGIVLKAKLIIYGKREIINVSRMSNSPVPDEVVCCRHQIVVDIEASHIVHNL